MKLTKISKEEFPADFIPVIYGNTLNGQSYSREFFDTYGTKSIMIAPEELWTTRESSFVKFFRETDLREDLRRLKKMDERPILLVATTDMTVEIIVDLLESGDLPDGVFTKYPSSETLSKVNQKAAFSKLCQELSIPHPVTRVVKTGDDIDVRGEFAHVLGPLWIKPSRRRDWVLSSVIGKEKAYRAKNIEEASRIVDSILNSNFDGEFVIQEEIPGGDELMLNMNAFCHEGEVLLSASGRVLLEQKGINTIGNPIAILSGDVPEGFEESVEKIAKHVGWNGWCNFDGKIDTRTGEVVVFESNPRLGRSHYFITAAAEDGYSAISPYVDLMRGEKVVFPPIREGVLLSCLPVAELLSTMTDIELIEKVLKAYSDGEVHNPLYSDDDSSESRMRVLEASENAAWWRE